MSRAASWALAVAVAFVQLAVDLSWLRGEHRLEALWQQAQLGEVFPELLRDWRRQEDPAARQLLLARGWLALAFDPAPLSRLGPRQAAERAAELPERLGWAQRLARKALEARPSSAEAAALIAALPLAQSLWRGQAPGGKEAVLPLAELASTLAPHDPQVLRLVAWVHLQLWSSLTPSERRAAQQVVRRALADPEGFQLLLPTWAEAAEGTEEFLAGLPESAWAWERLLELVRRGGDPAFACRVFLRHRDLLRQEALAALELAKERCQLGDTTRCRSVLLGLWPRLPVEASFASLAGQVLVLLPPPLPRGWAVQALGWLRLQALVYAATGQLLLPPQALRRLAAVLPPEQEPLEAVALLLSGDAVAADLVAERRQEAIGTAPWVPYLLAKARLLLHQGRQEQAQRVLEVLPPEAAASPLGYTLLQQTARPAQKANPAAAATFFPESAWGYFRQAPEFELLVKGPSQLELRWEKPAQGAVELLVDGASRGCWPLAERWLMVPNPLAPGAHLLQLRPVLGAVQVPQLRLVPSPEGEASAPSGFPPL
jgi:hypothetical protein